MKYHAKTSEILYVEMNYRVKSPEMLYDEMNYCAKTLRYDDISGSGNSDM